MIDSKGTYAHLSASVVTNHAPQEGGHTLSCRSCGCLQIKRQDWISTVECADQLLYGSGGEELCK